MFAAVHKFINGIYTFSVIFFDLVHAYMYNSFEINLVHYFKLS